MIPFRVDPTDTEPLFVQIVNTVKRGVAVGRLKPGERLPSVRELARELVINPNTIARAYQVLEADGVTLSRRGAGTFVAERRVVVRSDERRRRFKAALETVLADAVHLGLTAAEVEKAFAAAVKRFHFEEGHDE
ncbi:MAG: GntR family transcriptional regulator [Planctomycetota bacterium]|jgi:GntR family transcriptional regulator